MCVNQLYGTFLGQPLKVQETHSGPQGVIWRALIWLLYTLVQKCQKCLSYAPFITRKISIRAYVYES